MKLMIAEKEEKQEPVVRLKLVQRRAGVAVVAVDSFGCVINELAVFDARGTLTRCMRIDSKLGFDLNSSGQIILT